MTIARFVSRVSMFVLTLPLGLLPATAEEPPQFIAEIQPVSECAQMLTAYLDEHVRFLILVTILAVIGGLGVLDYTMRIGVGLLERGWDAWKARRTHG
jgi:hypothetical protein